MPGTAPVAMQRAAALIPLGALLAEEGVSLEMVLADSGITPDQLRPDTFIPYATFLAILDRAAALTGHPDLGLRMGQRQTLAALGPVGEAMRHAATLGEALTDFTTFQRQNSTGGAVYLMRAEEDVILGYGVYDASAQVSCQIYDLVLATGCNLIAELTGGTVGPEEIFLSRTTPGDPTPYQRLARCPLRFGQGHTALLLPAAALLTPLPTANATLHAQALSRLLSGTTGLPLTTAGQVRHLLRPMLLMGQAGMPNVAARLALHPRSLRRKLLAEGTTFEALKDEVRVATAREMLRLGTLTLADIAATLDYATPSAFLHAFRRWSGTSPGQWRDGAKTPVQIRNP